MDERPPPGLYVVGTPIGNMRDITLRAIDTLRACDLIFAEDTRQTMKLTGVYDIPARLVSCHKFNEASRVDRVCEAVEAGQVVGLVTDSGMPLISDPGARVVRGCRARGLPVTVIPGPSAVSAALALAGADAAGYHFLGFPSHKGAARRHLLEKWTAVSEPLVLYESPHRLLKLLADIRDVMGDRRVAVARELTKKFEELAEGPADEVLAHFEPGRVRGELVVVIYPAK